MATRDKYNYTQQTNLWGPINYIDVPSYSATSVGTTGDAYLVRNFLKQFFPFLDLSVKKTAGGSVNVAIQNFRVKFNFTEGGILKEFVLNAKSLEDVLEPLFEGQGFDGMTDSSYSIPLPPMYNDEGQDVSYGYGYLFVRNENTDGYYDVNLDLPTVRGGVIKYKFKVAYVSNIGLQDKIIEIPQKTIDYIKSNGVIPTVNIPQGIYPTPTQTNQSDLVTLEKGTINPASAVNLTLAQKDMVYFLAAVGIVPFEYIEENFKTAGTYQTTLIIIQELIAMDLVVPDNSQIPPLYQLTETGYDIFESFEGTIPKLLTPVVPKIELTTLEQEIIDFLLEKQKENVDVNLDRIKIEFQNRNYQQPILMKAISNLLVANLIDTKSGNNNIFYFVNEAGFASIGKAVLTTLEQEIINLLSELEEIFASVTIEILKSKTSYSEFMVEDRLFGLVNKGFVNQKKQDSIISYSLNESGLDLVTANDKTTVDAASLLTREPKTTASIGELAISEFIEKNIAIFNDMAQNAPELFDALGEGLLLVKKLASKDTGEPFPLISEENKLQLEDALSDDDFDLDEAELEQIDLSGIENDLELSDDELGDLDLDEFNELADFVENELMPSTKLKPVLLEILKILYITNSKLTADNIKNDLSMQEIFLNHKAVFNRLIELRDLQLVQEINSASNGIIWQITPEGEKYISNLAKSSGKASATDIENISEYLKKSSGKQISSSPTDIMLKEIADTLGYDFYLVLTLLNENNGLLSSGTVTELLQQKFNKKPKWDELEVLTMLRGLTSLGLSYTDVSGNEYFEITEKGENVVKYLSLREDIGLYPESKPTQQTVALRLSPTDIMLKERQEKAEKTGDELEYDYYLILKTLNDDTGLLTAGTITTILQRQFNKKPKWDVTEIRLKLRVLTSLGMAYMDVQNSIEYFEIREFGQDVVKYLIEQENKGLYPKSKPTQQTVASRPSPTQSATMNYVGTIAMGNDGNYWEVKENKNGVKRWVKSKL